MLTPRRSGTRSASLPGELPPTPPAWHRGAEHSCVTREDSCRAKLPRMTTIPVTGLQLSVPGVATILALRRRHVEGFRELVGAIYQWGW